MKKLRSNYYTDARKAACVVSAAALMLGVSHAASIGLKFTVDYCGFGNYVNYVNAPAFGMATNLWQNLTGSVSGETSGLGMGSGYHSCSTYTTFTMVDTISSSTVNSPPGGLFPLPNGSITVTWFGYNANWSGFAGYDAGSAGQPNPAAAPGRGEAEVYAGFIRDGVNFGCGAPDCAGPSYNIDIVGLKSVFTNTPFAIQLVASADSMQELTNAFIINANSSITQSVVYPAPQVYGNVGDAPWFRAIGGGISTVSTALTNDHLIITGNKAQHGTNGGGFNHGSTISGVIITDKPVVSMSPRPVSANAHDTVNLRTIAVGVPPLFYQWRVGAVPILNATNSSYSLTNIASGGSYDVVVTNLYGSAVSSASVVTVTPTDQLSILPDATGTNLVISWNSSSTLTEASAVTGPFTPVGGSPTSPYTNSLPTGVKFYRTQHALQSINSNPYDM